MIVIVSKFICRLLLVRRIFKIWKKYSIIVLNKEYCSRKKIIEKIKLERSKNGGDQKENSVVVYRALLLSKTAWKIWYRYSNKVE